MTSRTATKGGCFWRGFIALLFLCVGVYIFFRSYSVSLIGEVIGIVITAVGGLAMLIIARRCGRIDRNQHMDNKRV